MDRIWHGVIIKPDSKGRRRGEPALSRELAEEIEAWIIEHVGIENGQNGNNGIWKNTTFLVYEFTSEAIAMAFKLKWA